MRTIAVPPPTRPCRCLLGLAPSATGRTARPTWGTARSTACARWARAFCSALQGRCCCDGVLPHPFPLRSRLVLASPPELTLRRRWQGKRRRGAARARTGCRRDRKWRDCPVSGPSGRILGPLLDSAVPAGLSRAARSADSLRPQRTARRSQSGTRAHQPPPTAAGGRASWRGARHHATRAAASLPPEAFSAPQRDVEEAQRATLRETIPWRGTRLCCGWSGRSGALHRPQPCGSAREKCSPSMVLGARTGWAMSASTEYRSWARNQARRRAEGARMARRRQPPRRTSSRGTSPR